MLLKEIESSLIEQLSVNFGYDSAIQQVAWILMDILSINKTEYLLAKERQIEADLLERAQSMVNELLEDKPLQYVLGSAPFVGLSLKVDERVLIPRPETEELFLKAQKKLKKEPIKILDLCSGSGALAIASAHCFPNAKVTALELDHGAISLAEENAVLLKVNQRIRFMEEDLLSIPLSKFKDQFDLIFSNPPYIPEREKSVMKRNVLAYEPNMALFVPDNDPLIFYRKIFALSQEGVLAQGGLLAVEIHEDFVKDLVDLLTFFPKLEYSVEYDFRGKARHLFLNLR